MRRGQESIATAFDAQWLEQVMKLKTPTAIQVALRVAQNQVEGLPSRPGLLHDQLSCDVRTAQANLSRLTALGLLEQNADGYIVNASFAAPYAVRESRQAIPVALRRAVLERDGHACTYCGSQDALSLDHVIPWSRGGQDTLANLVTACRSCNSSKNARTPDEWQRAVN